MPSGMLNGRPSTTISMPPATTRLSPVAVTTTSASSSSPEASRIPSSVKVSIESVAMLAFPEPSTRKRSASGTRQTRWSQGS